MKVFGLELRKADSVQGLYEGVDATLKKHEMLSGGVSGKVQVNTVAHALQKMFKADSHFSVCTVQRCAKVCQVLISSERMDIYDAAHCISWNEMTEDYRAMITAMVLDDFREVLTSIDLM